MLKKIDDISNFQNSKIQKFKNSKIQNFKISKKVFLIYEFSKFQNTAAFGREAAEGRRPRSGQAGTSSFSKKRTHKIQEKADQNAKMKKSTLPNRGTKILQNYFLLEIITEKFFSGSFGKFSKIANSKFLKSTRLI